MSNIPLTHPRYHSLMTREQIVQGMREGLVHETGLIAHGRGEAFDYILGEKTVAVAENAARVAAASLLCARHPVLSVNGNVAVLVAQEYVQLSTVVPAVLEINLFHRSEQRIQRLIQHFHTVGADEILGGKADAVIPGLDHDRALCDKKGIYAADVVLVPLEDGDRCQALVEMGKTVIAIDINPLSRSAKSASITIVDNVIRAIPRIVYWVNELQKQQSAIRSDIIDSWDNKKNLSDMISFISKRLNSLYR